MREAASERDTKMIALFPVKQLEALEIVIQSESHKFPGQVCDIAAINGPSQVVISGDSDLVSHVSAVAKQHLSVRRATQLEVSAPFHCSLMAVAAERVKEELDKCTIKDPSVPWISNVGGKTVQSKDELLPKLIKQTTNRVGWLDCVQTANKEGATEFLEFGPRAVLKGLVEKIVPGAEVLCVS